ncbi:MAG: SCO family protein [Verrucomicrobia bacterium]|nr:SCO family protein [Verrucomicrobiota bacterium]
MKLRPTWPLRIALLVLAMLVGVIAALVQFRRALPPATHAVEERLPDLGGVAPFALTNAVGGILELDNLRGQVWVANLFFASCESICPRLTENLAQLQADVGPDTPFDLLSVSVDPEQDTPEAMVAFAATFAADTNRWHFATGPVASVHAFTAENLRIGPGNDPVGHSPYVALVDRAAHIRGYYNGLDAEALRRLAEDIKRVAAE